MVAKLLILIAGIVIGELATFAMICLCKAASDEEEQEDDE